MAEGPLPYGFDAALIGYTLAPDATLTGIVGEVRAAARWLHARGPASGVASGKFVLCCWSAGVHMTTMALADADAGLAVSGVYEREPCRQNYVNDKLKFTLDEQLALSPIRILPAAARHRVRHRQAAGNATPVARLCGGSALGKAADARAAARPPRSLFHSRRTRRT